jgi:uncharacterized protein (TIGR02271 family)
MTPSGTQQTRTITAFFDSRTDADEAVRRLHAAGFAQSAVRLTPGYQGRPERDVNPDSYRGAYENNEGFGFWEALKDLFLPEEDRHAYAEGLRRGGYLVTVQTGDASYARALDILDDEGTIDIDERAASWRSEGWTGYTGPDYRPGEAATTAGVAALGSGARGRGTGETAGGRSSAEERAAGAAAATRAAPVHSKGEEVIPVAEEELRVGKREVSGGRVRVRSYVIETPVQEQVNLRKEHVSVERRPVDRAATSGDNLFRERTIEAEERAEEAVVSKEARVKEELVLKKGVEHRTETVSDKVRKTEVEVEDERGNALRSGERKTTR